MHEAPQAVNFFHGRGGASKNFQRNGKFREAKNYYRNERTQVHEF